MGRLPSPKNRIYPITPKSIDDCRKTATLIGSRSRNHAVIYLKRQPISNGIPGEKLFVVVAANLSSEIILNISHPHLGKLPETFPVLPSTLENSHTH